MKNIVITGCSRGIGLAMAQALSQSDHYHVIGTSTSGTSPLKHPNFTCYCLSLDDKPSIAKAVSQLTDKKIQLHGLINNAAILLEDWDDPHVDHQTLRKTFEVNLFGTIDLTEKLLPFMSYNSHIINMSSNWGSFSDTHFSAFQPHYKMSKTALNMYTKLLAERLKDRHITVSSFDPGWVKTDMGGMNASKEPWDVGKEIFDLLQGNIPSGYFWRNNKKREW